MQHQPHLTETLEHLLKGKLKETSYPFVDNQPGVGPNSSLQRYANPALSSTINPTSAGRKI